MQKKLKVCFMGGKHAGILGVLTILAKGHQVVAAVSYSTDLENLLTALAVPVYKSIKNEGFKNELKGSDILLSVHGREIVKPDLLGLPRLGGVNLHPYLYKYKGADPVGRALKDGEFKASVGAHVMEQGVDEGRVLIEEFLDVSGSASVDEIYNRLYPVYSIVMLKVLDKIEAGYDKNYK